MINGEKNVSLVVLIVVIVSMQLSASFQRTESNKDGVMLLGVKTSGAEENGK